MTTIAPAPQTEQLSQNEPETIALDLDNAVERTLTRAHDEVQLVVWKIEWLAEYTGNEPELERVTDAHIGAVATIRSEVKRRVEELAKFEARLDRGIDELIALKSRQAFRESMNRGL